MFQDVIIGFIVGMVIPGWLVLGSIIYRHVSPVLPVSTMSCFNATLHTYSMSNQTRYVATLSTVTPETITIQEDRFVVKALNFIS